VKLSGTTASEAEFEIIDVNHPENPKGSMISRGIMSGITGNPGDIIIIDDVVKNRQEADSPVYRERVWDEWQNSIKTRLTARGKVIIIMTRWHSDDLAGRVKKSEGDRTYTLTIPCEAEGNDILGRKPGDALFPEIGKDNEWLRRFKKSYIEDAYEGGLRAWLALFQQKPVNEEGNIVKRTWWKYFDESQIPHMNFDMQLQSWDMTFKGDEDTDRVAGQAWGVKGANIYLLDLMAKRMNFTDTIHAVEDMTAQCLQEGRPE
jgi:hypothetical protein